MICNLIGISYTIKYNHCIPVPSNYHSMSVNMDKSKFPYSLK